MKTLKLCGLVLALFSAVALAQNAREGAEPDSDISGMYSFLHDGESVQLNWQDGLLTGWITSYGILESDKDTLVDRFFKDASLNGDQIHFATKPLHGSWFEFTGRVERGEAKTRAQEGYYRLTGTLTQYVSDMDNNVTARERQAVFKSAAEDVLAEAPK